MQPSQSQATPSRTRMRLRHTYTMAFFRFRSEIGILGRTIRTRKDKKTETDPDVNAKGEKRKTLS